VLAITPLPSIDKSDASISALLKVLPLIVTPFALLVTEMPLEPPI
jgi:hypothetical protein